VNSLTWSKKRNRKPAPSGTATGGSGNSTPPCNVESPEEKREVVSCPHCKGQVYADSLGRDDNTCPHCKDASGEMEGTADEEHIGDTKRDFDEAELPGIREKADANTKTEVEADIFKFNCPHCQQRLESPDEMIGQTIDCPACTKTLTIPKFKKKQSSTIKDVKFKAEDVSNGNTYLVYTASSRNRALEFLRAKEVKEEREYLIVETPEGNLGKDLIIIFDERNSEKVEFGIRRPQPKLIMSKTHCARCGYSVLPAGTRIPGVTEMILLDDMKEKGVGFWCCNCGMAWCPFCISGETPEKCQMCGEEMSIYRK
jgi:hypothetical protein